MSLPDLCIAQPSAQQLENSIWCAPFDALDDAALLAHFRAPREVHYYAVADADETRPDKIEALMHGRFEFNGETHAMPDPLDWLANPSKDVEWHILLHKFYYAVGLGLAFKRSGEARYARRWAELLDGWMASTPPGFIAADVTGRRVQNWIYSYHLFVTHAARTAIDAAFHRRLLQSLHEQVEYLCTNLAPKRNHRTLELFAIFLAGAVFPEMRRATHWREFALDQTIDNLKHDFLSDGVHCELSTDYHHLVLRNVLHIRQLATMNTMPVPAAMDEALQRALEFSLHAHKPDGLVPSLSDGDSRSFLELLQQGAELYGREDMLFVATRGAKGTAPQRRIAHFAASGYSVLRSGWGQGGADFADQQYLVFDCGPLGEGNHGHFDCLSLELAAFGRSLIVDPGRYTYSEAIDPAEGINWRVHFRGTAAHNTVCVDGLNQTRYMPKVVKETSRHANGSVRHKISGPPPRAQMLERYSADHLDLLHGCAQSYEYDALHERCIVFVDRSYWIVSDWLRADSEHGYVLNFQLGAHANGHAELSLSDGLRVRSPGLLIAQPARAGVHHALADSWVSARYGDKQPAPALRSSITARNANFDTLLLPWRGCEPAIELEDCAVQAAGSGAVTGARALRLRMTVAGERVTDTWFHARDASVSQWRIGRFEFRGRWLHWRESAEGRVLHAISHANALLQEASGSSCTPVTLETAEVA
ncbi:MAG: heparinase II/III family protein [Burkholderiaceae bacterium]|nr:heparinase II/III family protein [Burkholderiaceae bacterium]